MSTFKLIRDMSENLSLERSEVVEMLRQDDIKLMSYAEAEAEAEQHIEQSLWAFNASFLVGYINAKIDTNTLQRIKQDSCEDCNEVFLALVGDNLERLKSDAIGCDGIGHFLNTYDGDAYEYYYNGELYLYWRV